MNEDRKEAWRKTLILWEAISNKPSTSLETIINPKSELLESLGFEQQQNSCPLCEIYFENRKCTSCPIKTKFNHTYEEVPCRHIRCPYRQYSDVIIDKSMHYQILADLFYKWLIDLAKEEGYKPDLNLKYW